MATSGKRAMMEDGSGGPMWPKKAKPGTSNYYGKGKKVRKPSGRTGSLQVGQRGFMVTCNYQERDCLRDSYRLLNEYADELYGKVEGDDAEKEAANSGSDHEEEQEEEDISDQVAKQAEAARKGKRQFRFQSVETGLNNCCFITTTLENPRELALKIVYDLVETKQQKSRNILRMLPIEAVTKANLMDIMNTAGALFDKYFLKEPKSFAIIFNRRYNNSLDRTRVINELARIIVGKNPRNKTNLKRPDLAVIVEVIKGMCMISVVPHYYELKKYNLVEIFNQKAELNKDAEDDGQSSCARSETAGEDDGKEAVAEDEESTDSPAKEVEERAETILKDSYSKNEELEQKINWPVK
ncbi:THUMP domain-containing protein 1 homolog [Sabethes cyaneus]|uniref:THUMP domain-containing protein 1 homolog n=1 Tax=Sabethes cyaneus TaxID=53552 RepID=UPI00221E29B4|nr:THUMP domain-containing protein 1 homolog [Sabethes cyaneus]